MTRWSKRVTGFLAVSVAWAATASAIDASYIVRGPQAPVSHAVNGYTQSVVERADGSFEVRVSVERVPVGSRGRAWRSSTRHPDVPEGFGLPPTLANRLASNRAAYDAATEILRWMAKNVDLDPDSTGDQDAASVLRRRAGRCSGVANATVALLITAGFEARTVSGLLVTEQGPVPHRWVECRLPGAGWVATDPTLGFWVVSHRHVVFRDTVRRMPEVEPGRVPPGFGLEFFPREGGWPRRPDEGGELVVRMVGPRRDGPVVARLHGAGGELRESLLDPVGRFSGLMPGTWLLRVDVGTATVHEQVVTIDEGDVRSYAVREVTS